MVKRRKTTKDVLAAAKATKDRTKQVRIIAQGMREVTNPAKLVPPLAARLYKTKLEVDACSEQLITICREQGGADVLGACGVALDRHYASQQALVILDDAYAAGCRDPEVLALYGRLLLSKGDDRGETVLQTLLAEDPESTTPRIDLALARAWRSPEQALALIEAGLEEDSDDPARLHEVHAMLLDRLGRDSKRATRKALEAFSTKREAHFSLAQWHSEEDRYPRALVHARALRPKAKTPEEIELILAIYRFAGAFAELVPWIVELCRDEVPEPYAFDILEGLDELEPLQEPELARRAARALATSAKTAAERETYEVRIAGISARLGDLAALDVITRELGNNPVALATAALKYLEVERLDRARDVARRALALDPRSSEVLVALIDVALEDGDASTARTYAERLCAIDPFEHHGPEDLARVLIRTGDHEDAENALALSERALRMAPYCGSAWNVHAEALAVIGQLERAREHVIEATKRSVVVPGSPVAILRSALEKDIVGFERECEIRRAESGRTLPFPNFLDRLRAIATM